MFRNLNTEAFSGIFDIKLEKIMISVWLFTFTYSCDQHILTFFIHRMEKVLEDIGQIKDEVQGLDVPGRKPDIDDAVLVSSVKLVTNSQLLMSNKPAHYLTVTEGY